MLIRKKLRDPPLVQRFTSLWPDVSSCLLSLFLSVDWSQQPCSPLHPRQGNRKSEQSKMSKEISHSKGNPLKWAYFLAEIQTFELILKDTLGVYQYFLPRLQTKMINSVPCITDGETHIKYEGTSYFINSSNSEVKNFLHCSSRFSNTIIIPHVKGFLLRSIFHLLWDHLCICSHSYQSERSMCFQGRVIWFQYNLSSPFSMYLPRTIK